MPRFAVLFIRSCFVTVGVTGAVVSSRYWHRTYTSGHPSKDGRLIYLAAITLSSAVVERSLKNDEVVTEFKQFGLNLLGHPVVVRQLKDYFIADFTNDTATRRCLKSFVVQDVIMDSWVKDGLLDVVGNITDAVITDPDIYPSAVLHWLGDCAITGIFQERFQSALKAALKDSCWLALIGPPPPSIVFDTAF